MDPLVLLDIEGRYIHQALENGVSQWPKLDGRFPQVSGISFAFDPSKPPGSRVDCEYVKVGGEYLDPEKHYRVVTKSYLGIVKITYLSLLRKKVESSLLQFFFFQQMVLTDTVLWPRAL